jgi:protein-disulfide isomerase
MTKQQAPVSKRAALRADRNKKAQRNRLNTIAIAVGAGLLVAALLILPSLIGSLTPAGEFVRITPNAYPQAERNALGDPNAPVKIFAYSDYQCPFCKRFHDETEKLIIDTYVATGKVYYTYTPYGPGGRWIGVESEHAAWGAFCAADQGKFFEFNQILFANHTGENVGDFTDKRLGAFAESLGLNMGDFNSCFSSQKYADEVATGLDEGRRAGIQGTPSFIINGKIVQGALPFESFQTEIEAALAAAVSN